MAAEDYQVFGLKVRSEIPLPELFKASGNESPDVIVRHGPIRGELSKRELEADGDALVLTIPDIARYRIEGGREILVDANPGVPDRNLRLFLLGSAFGVLLHQRGLMPLHANAVEIGGQAFAFMGESGAGKSTLAAWFHDRGFPVIADDVCVVGLTEDGRACAYPGLPRLRLWEEVLGATGRDSAQYQRSYIGDDAQAEKFDVPIDPAGAAGSPLPLTAIYVLERGHAFSIGDLTGVEAIEAIFANTYRGEYLAMTNGQQQHWNFAISLVRGTAVFRAVREWDLAALEDQCCRLLRHAQEASTCLDPCGNAGAGDQA